MVVPTRHGNSRAVPTPRANKSSHVAGSAPFLADTVGQSHSLNDATNMNPKRNTHGEHWSPCVFRRPGHEEQYPDLLPCPTDDARTAEKPVGRAPKKGYARHLLTAVSLGPARNWDLNPTMILIYYVLLPLRYLAVWPSRQPASSGSTVLP